MTGVKNLHLYLTNIISYVILPREKMVFVEFHPVRNMKRTTNDWIIILAHAIKGQQGQ